jgi:serine/threonine protein phosphatase 1
MKLQNRDTLLWARDEFIFSPALKDYVIIFGHTPTCDMQSSNPMTIWHDKDKIGIDCGSVFGKGQLGCLRLDDMKEFYV